MGQANRGFQTPDPLIKSQYLAVMMAAYPRLWRFTPADDRKEEP